MTGTDTGMPAYIASIAVAIFGAMTVQEWVAVCGLILAVATFAINWWYKARDDVRRKNVSDARIDRINRDMDQ